MISVGPYMPMLWRLALNNTTDTPGRAFPTKESCRKLFIVQKYISIPS